MSIARRGIFFVTALTIASGAFAAGNAVKGRVQANTCMGCHGIPGYTRAYPNYRVPKLGGQNAQYIVDALKEYKKGARKFATMNVQSSALGSQEMENIAAFLSQAPRIPDDLNPPRRVNPQGKPPAKVATCGACHGKHGVAKHAMFPNLAGQYYSYLRHALHAYKSGARKNAIMNAQASSLTNGQIDELAAWFSSQPPKLYTPSVHQPFTPQKQGKGS